MRKFGVLKNKTFTRLYLLNLLYNNMSCHSSCHVMSWVVQGKGKSQDCHVMSHVTCNMLCHAMPCHVMSCHMSCLREMRQWKGHHGAMEQVQAQEEYPFLPITLVQVVPQRHPGQLPM